MGGRRTQGHSDLGQAPWWPGLPGVAGPLGESHELAHGQLWELLPLPLVSAPRAPTGLIPLFPAGHRFSVPAPGGHGFRVAATQP